MKDSQELRNEIVTDFATLQTQVQEQTQRNESLSAEVLNMEERIRQGQSAVHVEKEQGFMLQQQTQKFFLECYNVLLNVRHKYAGDELLQG